MSRYICNRKGQVKRISAARYDLSTGWETPERAIKERIREAETEVVRSTTTIARCERALKNLEEAK